MMKRVMLGIALFLGGAPQGYAATEHDTIRDLIKTSYLNGAYNDVNITNLRKGFHKDFEMTTVKGEELSRLGLEDWISMIEKQKKEGMDRKMTARILAVDVSPTAATAKIELTKKGHLAFTDYLSLLKFPEGWKIVSKIYHVHPQVVATSHQRP